MVTSMLQVFYIDVNSLLYLNATLSFVTPLVAKNFDVLPNVLIEPFLVTTLASDSVVSRSVLRSFIYFCPI